MEEKVIFDDNVKQAVNDAVLWWLTFADENGVPSVSPKEMFVPFADNKVIIANIASPNSARNIRSNPDMCISFVDIFTQKGYKLLGTAQVIEKSQNTYQQYVDVIHPVKALSLRWQLG